MLQKAAGDVDKLTAAHERGTNVEKKRAAASVETARKIDDATKRFEAYTASLEKGNRETDTSVKQLQAFGREFDRLGGRAKAGSDVADSMYKLGQQAREMASAMKKASDDQAVAEAQNAQKIVRARQQAETARKKEAEQFVKDVRSELAADDQRAKQFDQNLQREERGYRQRILSIQQGRDAVEAAQRAETDARAAADAADAKSVQTRIQRQRSLETEIARAVRAQKNAATEMERDAARARVASAASGLRGLGVAETDVRRTLTGAASAVTGGRGDDAAITTRQRRINELAAAQRALRDMPAPRVSFIQRLLGGNEERLGSINNLLQDFEKQSSKASFSAVRLAGNLRGMVIIGAVVFFQQLVGVGVALGGTLVAVASAAIQAGAAIGGALVSGAAQAIPVIGLLAAAWGRVGAVFKAVQQAQKARQAAAYDEATAADRQRQAADGVRSAQEALANSQRQAADAQRNLSKAREDGVRQIQDLVTAEKQAQLQAESARLAQEDAMQTFRRSIATGNLNDLASQSIQARQTTLDVATTGRTANRARFDANRAVAGGVEGLDSVRAARQAVADANRSIADAQRGLKEAQTVAAEGVRQTATADRLLAQLLGQLSPAERKLYNALERIRKDYRDAFTGKGGVTESIIGAFTYAVDRADALLRSRRLLNSARALSSTIAQQLRHLTDFLTSPGQVGFLEDMAKEARRNLPIVENGIQHILHLLENIARAGAPAFHTFLQFLDNMIGNADRATSSGGGLSKLERFFSKGEQYAESFIHLGGALTRLFLAIIGTSAQQGGNAIDSATKSINKATGWINSHRSDVRQFFREAIDSTGKVLQVVGVLAKDLFSLFSPGQVNSFAAAIKNTILPSLVDMFKVTGMISKIFLDIAGSPVLSLFARLAATTILLRAAVSPLVSIILRMVIGFGRLTSSVALVRGGLVGLRAVTGPWGLAFAAISATLLIITGRVHSFGDAVKALIPIIASLALVFVGRKGLSSAILGASGALEKLGMGKAAGSLLGAGGKLEGIASKIGLGRLFSGGGAAAGAAGAENAAAGAAGAAGAGAAGAEVAGAAGLGARVLGRAVPLAGAGIIGGQLISSLGSGVIGHRAASTLGMAATGAGIGAAAGSVVPVLGTAAGALVGGSIGAGIGVINNYLGKGKDALQKFQDKVKDLPKDLNKISPDTLKSLSDQAEALTKKFPKSADALRDFVKSANQELSRRLGGVMGDMKSNFDIAEQYAVDKMAGVRLAVQRNMAEIRRRLGDDSQAGRQALTANFVMAAQSIQDEMKKGLVSTRTGLKEIRKLFIQALGDYGITPAQARKLGVTDMSVSEFSRAMQPTGAGQPGLVDQINRSKGVGGAQGGFMGAAAGYLKGAGHRGGDVLHRVLAPGEAVLNWAHQSLVEPAMREKYGFGLAGLFDRVNARHGQEYGSGMASGGFVPEPGTNFSYGDEPRIVTALRRLASIMHTTIYGISGYRSPQHSVSVGGFANDPHTQGMAADIGVGSLMRSSASSLSDRLLARVGLYRPFYPQSAAEINHVQLLAAAGARGGRNIVGAANATATQTAAAIAKQIKTPGVKQHGLAGAIVKGLLGNVTRLANLEVRRASNVSGAADAGGSIGNLGGFKGGGSNQANMSLARRMLAASTLNAPGAWNALKYIWGNESGFDATIHYGGGHGYVPGLAYGIPQSLPGNKMASAGRDWMTNAATQIKWGLGYIKERYGSLANAAAFWRSHHAYDIGGAIPGQGPKPILAHGGEHMWTAAEVAKAGGHQVMFALRRALGGGGQGGASRRYATGGAISPYSEPLLHGIDPAAWNTQINSAQRVLGGIRSNAVTSRFTDALSKTYKSLLGDGGLFDELADAISTMTDRIATTLKLATYRVTKTGNVIQRLDDVGVADRTVANLERAYKAMHGEQKQLEEGMADVARRLENRHLSQDQRAYLTGVQRNIRKRLDTVRSSIADNIDSTYSAVSEAISSRVTRASDAATVSTGRLDLQQSWRDLVGDTVLRATGAASNSSLGQARAAILNNEADALQKAFAYATSHGHAKEAAAIQDQINEIRQNAAQAIADGISKDVDSVNNEASRASSQFDLRDRISTLLQNAGDYAGAFSQRGATLAGRGQSLQSQRTQLTALFGQAQAAGAFALMQSIGDQIASLDVDMQENSAAIRENTNQARQAAIDAITSRGSFLGGVYSGLYNVVSTLGQITGTTDRPTMLGLLNQQGSTLAGTGQGLLQQLLGYGINLTGMSPTQLVGGLSGLNYDQIESGMTTTERQTFEGLINAIIENTGAQVSNTQQIKQLTAPNAQSWSSTAWTWFRNAIFDGAGGLLPQYQNFALGIGSMPAVGPTPGLAAAAGTGSNGGNFVAAITNHEHTEDMDPDTLANRLWAKYRDRPKGS